MKAVAGGGLWLPAMVLSPQLAPKIKTDQSTRGTTMANLHTATRKVALPALLLLAASGCQTTPFIESAQPEALQAATRRGQFEFGCPAASGQVLSQENVVSPLQNTFRFSPPQRAEYTIGVSGCGKRTTYLVVCSDGGGGCVAAGQRTGD
jgi:hypothetical protein